MRADKLLWFLRLAKTRSIAQELIEEVDVDGAKLFLESGHTGAHGSGKRWISSRLLATRMKNRAITSAVVDAWRAPKNHSRK